MGRPLWRAAVLVLVPVLATAACAGQCGARGGLPPSRPPSVTGPDGRKYHLVDRGPYKAYYDRWGRMQRIEYDSNGDGRPDQIAIHDGRRRPYRLDVDADFDGRTDRWERYDEAGTLERVGTASAPGRAPDVWAIPGADGTVARREYDADGNGAPERVEVLTAGVVTAIELDGDRDRRIDRWQAWEKGHLQSEDLDTDGDGRADRRLRYDARGSVVKVEGVGERAAR